MSILCCFNYQWFLFIPNKQKKKSNWFNCLENKIGMFWLSFYLDSSVLGFQSFDIFEASCVFPYSLFILVHVFIISHLKYCVILLISLPPVLCPLKLTAILFIVIVLKIFKSFLLIGKCVNFSVWVVVRSFFVILIF